MSNEIANDLTTKAKSDYDKPFWEMLSTTQNLEDFIKKTHEDGQELFGGDFDSGRIYPDTIDFYGNALHWSSRSIPSQNLVLQFSTMYPKVGFILEYYGPESRGIALIFNGEIDSGGC